MLSYSDWDFWTKTHLYLIFASFSPLKHKTATVHVLAYLFLISRLLTSIVRIFILQLHFCCKSSPDTSSHRMHVKCIVPALSLTPLFTDAMNCGLLPEITVAWTPKPFPSLRISTKKGIPSPAHCISPNLIPGCGICCFQKAWLCYPQSAKLTTSTTTIWQRVRKMCDPDFITDSYFSVGKWSKITKFFDLILLLFLVWCY